MDVLNTELFTEGGWPLTIVTALLILIGTFVVAYVLNKLFLGIFKQHRGGEVAGSIFTLIIKTAVWFAGIGLMLKVCFDFDVTIIWGALGVGGIALSLGLQNTISNLLGGVFVSFGTQISIGDWIECGSVAGIVKDINWRCAVIEDDVGDTHSIPNSVLNSTTVTVKPEYMRVPLPLVLNREADTDELTPILCKIADDALRSKGMQYEGKPPVLVCTGLTAEGVQATLVVFSCWQFSTASVNDTVLPPVVRYLQDNNLYGRWT